MEILVLLIIVYACKKGFTDTKHAAAKSHQAYLASADKRYPDMPKGKRAAHAAKHDAGWGLSELVHGFPTVRHGFGEGWHESRQAHHKAMLGRQEAKTAQLETRAGAVGQLRDYRARQQAALEQIRSGTAPGTPVVHDADTVEPEEGTSPEEEGTPDGSSPNAPTGYSYGSAHVPSSWPADDVETARREAAYWSQGGTPQQVHQYHGENPGELLETYVNGELISPEEGRELDEQYASQREHIRQRHADRGPLGIPFSPGGTTVTEDHWDAPLPGEDSEHVVGHPGSPADVAVVGNRQWAEDIAREESKNGGRVIVSPRGLGTEPVAAFVNGEAVPLEPAEEGSPAPEEGTPEGTSSSTPETSPTSTASTEGTTMAGDTSYNEIDQGLTQDHDTAETLAAEQQQAAAQQEQAANAARSALAKTNAMIDAAEGLKLDTATTSELMEHAEAQREAAAASDAAHEAHLAALAAHQRVMETSQTGQSTLRTNHGQYQQAHDDSPVDSADADFYAA